LSTREREVLQLVAEGRAMKEIGARLGITTRTVAFHKYRLMEKLGVRSTAELVQVAARHRLV
jgi:DNA-binding CsgD family transcriptional regulator